MSRILFISHDAHRTGAPILLLNLLKEVRRSFPAAEFRVLLKYGGDLEGDFKEVDSKTVVYNYPFYRWSVVGRLVRAAHKLSILRHIYQYKPDVILANTVVCSDMLSELKAKVPAAKIVMHVHELQMSIERYIGEDVFRQAIPLVDKFICASEKVKNNLLERYAIAPAKLVKIYEFLEDKQHQEPIPRSSESFKIVGCGTLDWRKSPQLFVQIASIVNKKLPLKAHHITFTWIGGSKTSIEYQELQYDIERLGIEENVHFVGGMKNPSQVFQQSDVFLLTSREDPYPLVCLEAALTGAPIICFEEAGGMPEFVEEDAGWVVPYLDIHTVADRIVSLFHDRNKVLQKGLRAQQKVKERHSLQNAAREIMDVISSVQ